MSHIFSLLTAGYNNAPYLSDWRDSILRQSYRPLEVVYVNDSSDDDTLSRLEPLAADLEAAGVAFKLVTTPQRLYYASCLKKAVGAATGDFFGILDSDDAIVGGSVEYVMDLYNRFPNVGYVYTQFEVCNHDLKTLNKGFSSAPKTGHSLLSSGRAGKHTYSHWRTFSRRCPRLDKLFLEGQRCAVDKYMGYRLEEFCTGMFSPRVCYRWRTGNKQSITRTEPAKAQWRKVMKEADARRLKYKLRPYPVLTAPTE